MILTMAYSSIAPSLGLIPPSSNWKLSNSFLFFLFEVVGMKRNYPMPLTLARPFLATVDANMDWPNMIISYAKIDRNFFYQVVPVSHASKQVPRITMIFDKKLR